MAELPVTRNVLARRLVRHAALRPRNVAVPLGLLGAAWVLTPWLVVVAVLTYAALVVATFLDGDVAESVGRDVYARTRRRLPESRDTARSESAAATISLAYTAERQIRHALDQSPVSLPEVDAEVQGLLHELEGLAAHVDRLAEYLADEDEAELRARLERVERLRTGDSQVDRANADAAAALQQQLDARKQLSLRLTQFEAQMEHIAATLGVVHAQIMRVTAAEASATQTRVAEQIRSVRSEVDATAAAFDEAYRELD
jgi:uncharacterized protein YoxC